MGFVFVLHTTANLPVSKPFMTASTLVQVYTYAIFCQMVSIDTQKPKSNRNVLKLFEISESMNPECSMFQSDCFSEIFYLLLVNYFSLSN